MRRVPSLVVTTSCVLVALRLASAEPHPLETSLADLVSPDAQVRRVVDACRFTEGPAYSPRGYLLFSDIPNSRVLRVNHDGTSSEFLKPSGRANGLAFDASGVLYACQGGEHRVVKLDPDKKGEVTVLAEEYGGKKLNSPNDLALDDHGGLYFTDPHYGKPEDRQQDVMGVYYINAAGKLTRVIADLTRPNGILVSNDGRFLYVAEIDHRQLFRYAIKSPGVLGERTLLFTGDEEEDGRGPDGMTLDASGNIYATYKKLVVLDPAGKLIGRIDIPEKPANCIFGGPKGRTLYVTARTSLYSLETNVFAAPLRGAAARSIQAGDLRLALPANWKTAPPRNQFRKAQATVPAAGGDANDAEFVVFFFGAGGGGGVAMNLDRWIKQFEPEGRKVELRQGKCAQGNYVVADIRGTYNMPIGPPIRGQTKRVPNARVLAAIIETKGGAYFLKLSGPGKTVGGAAGGFRRAFGADPANEQPLELE